jgi:hypothetical protein
VKGGSHIETAAGLHGEGESREAGAVFDDDDDDAFSPPPPPPSGGGGGPRNSAASVRRST